MQHVDYDAIGRTYTATRRADPRIAGAIRTTLGDARSVLNVGAGAGAYEPPDLEVTAVEPSPVMIAQRPPGAAPATEASAEDLPFADRSFDAVMAILSDHHWRDRARGYCEMRRVARRRVVLFNADPAEAGLFWLTREYLPSFLDLIPEDAGIWRGRLREAFGEVTLHPVPIPHDCADGFYGAFWRRPAAYLDPAVRAGISVFARLAAGDVERGLEALRRDLESGAWAQRHRDLLRLDELHLGYYVAVAEVDTAPMPTANVDIVRQALVANRSGPPEDTVEAVVAVAHPDVEFASRVSVVEGQMYRGHEGIRRYFSDFAEVFEEWHNEPQEVVELGPDVVLAENEFRAVGKGSGMAVGLRTAAVVTLSGGKMLRIRTYATREEALAAEGFAG